MLRVPCYTTLASYLESPPCVSPRRVPTLATSPQTGGPQPDCFDQIRKQPTPSPARMGGQSTSAHIPQWHCLLGARPPPPPRRGGTYREDSSEALRAGRGSEQERLPFSKMSRDTSATAHAHNQPYSTPCGWGFSFSFLDGMTLRLFGAASCQTVHVCYDSRVLIARHRRGSTLNRETSGPDKQPG